MRGLKALELVASACVLLIACGAHCASGAKRPDAAFVAAALHKQEVACGASLQVRYTLGPLVPHYPHGSSVHRYTRTPTVLFDEHTRSTVSVSGSTLEHRMKSRCDRSSGYCVLVSTSVPDGLLAARIQTDRQISGVFANGSMVADPVLYHLATGPLCEVIAKGVVSENQEEIDGSKCWRIDVPEKQIGMPMRFRCSIWVDPALGFCPRRVRETMAQNSSASVYVTDFSGYRSIANHVYFPMRITVRFGVSGANGTLCTVDEAVCGKEVSADAVTVTIPSGAKVTDLNRQTKYTQP